VLEVRARLWRGDVEEEEVLDARVEQVTCRWCGASGPSIEELPSDSG